MQDTKTYLLPTLNSKRLTTLENVGTGILYCKGWGLVIPYPTRNGMTRYTFTYRICFPPQDQRQRLKKIPLYINWGHADPMWQVWM